MTTAAQKRWHRINLALFACCIVSLVIYDIQGGLWRKGFTSLWFLALGLVNLCISRKAGLSELRYPRLIVLGLFCGMCADVLLGLWFYLGVAFFALGHILYLIGFFSLEKFRRADLYLFIPIGAISMYLVAGTPFIRVEDPMMKTLLLGYALIIAAMLGKAISNFLLRKNRFRALVLLGSLMFWISDLVLAVDMFGQSSRLTWVFCSYVYWPAQCIQAYSLFHFTQGRLRPHDS